MQTPPRQVSPIPDDAFQRIMAKLAAGHPLANPGLLDLVVADLGDKRALDPVWLIRKLMFCSPDLATLYRADLGLARQRTAAEHTYAVLHGFEQDHRPLYAGNPELLKIMRLAALIKCAGKSLSINDVGDNQDQKFFNNLVVKNLLDSINPHVLSSEAKEIVGLLINQDVIGGALQGSFDQEEPQRLRESWPPEFHPYLDDFVITLYLCNAAAHSAYRSYVDIDAADPVLIPCVTAADEPHTLTGLFERTDGQPLSLQSPYRQAVAALLPHSSLTRSLIVRDGEQSHVIPSDERAHDYRQSAEAVGTWSATLRLPPYHKHAPLEDERRFSFDDVATIIKQYVDASGIPISSLVTEGRYGVTEITLIRDPSAVFGAPSTDECTEAATALQRKLRCDLEITESSDVDFTACLGLLEGYDRDDPTATYHKSAEVVPPLFRRSPGTWWRSRVARLLFARRISTEEGDILSSDNEKVLVIEGHSAEPEAARAALRNLAGITGQARYFMTDHQHGRTVAFRQARGEGGATQRQRP